MAKSTDKGQATAFDLSMETSHLPGRDVLDRDTFRALNIRSDWHGGLRLVTHIAIILGTGVLVHLSLGTLGLLIPVMVLHGFAIVSLFAPMHECVHRTAFRSRWLNDTVGWLTGVASFYNSDYYRRYHHWHHRYTQVPGQDPELTTPKPRSVADYVLRISGLLFWRDKIQDMAVVASGRVDHFPFLNGQTRSRVVWSMRIQVAIYVIVIAGAWLTRSPAPFIYWLLPAILGQPLLRLILIAEHTGCSEDTNGLTNTRTTLTSWPVRLMMWNMPYHAEHHAYPAVPFYALPKLHYELRNELKHKQNGYPQFHLNIIKKLL